MSGDIPPGAHDRYLDPPEEREHHEACLRSRFDQVECICPEIEEWAKQAALEAKWRQPRAP